MSNQEGMFADAEQQSYEPRPINVDPREQAQQQESPQEQESQEEYGGYRGSYVDPGEQQRGGGKIYPEQRPRPSQRRSRWPLIVIVILAILFASGFVSRASTFRGAPETRTFQTLSGTPNLVITDPNGNVRVHTGNSDGITITATRSDSLFGGNSNNAVQYKQDGNTINVTAPGGFGFLFGSGSVDLDVSVPDTANVQVQSGSGDIEIAGPNGNIVARSGSGDVTINGVQQGTVEADAGSGSVNVANVDAAMTLHSGSGDVDARNVDGQVNATDGSGDVSVRDSTLSGQSLLETGSGDVNFSGTLAPDGSYQMRSGSGDVNVTLPNNVSFQLNAHSDSGDVSNEFGSNSVGSAPRPPLQINTGSGDIEINSGD
jgi:hypothetical protein